MPKKFGDSSSSDSDTEVVASTLDPLAATRRQEDVDQQLLEKAVTSTGKGRPAGGEERQGSPEPHPPHTRHKDPHSNHSITSAGSFAGSPQGNTLHPTPSFSVTPSAAASPQNNAASPLAANGAMQSPRGSAAIPTPRDAQNFSGDTSRSNVSNSEIDTASVATPTATDTASNAQQHQAVTLEFGDEYFGEVTKVEGSALMVPHGSGTLQSTTGKHCYVGDFNMRLRDGYGKLVTERFVLWSKWKGNRPDLTSSARIDYTNGDKYAGYLTLFQDPAAMQVLMRTQTTSLSKFSIWVRASSMLREKWGEIVQTDGSRYFGQWERNMMNGFGCQILPNGDRYVGMFRDGAFDGTGVLFTASIQNAGSVAAGGMSSTATASGQSRSRTASPQNSASSPSNAGSSSHVGAGVIFDGTWKQGKFVCEEGYAIFPCRTRVTADWTDSSHCTRADIHFSSRSSSSKPWLETFHWEALLCGGSESGRRKDFIDALPTRNAINGAKTKQEVVEELQKLIHDNSSIANSVKIFRRCFYFMYGTCGSSTEIGAGMGGNTLGWCYVRNAFGGCIHRGRGRPILKEDINNALGDIVSFVSSVRRWVDELIGPRAVESVQNHDLETFIARQILDIVLHDVHAPFFNLYVQVYGKEEVALKATLEQLNTLTMDDLGVQFGRHNEEEKLFDPYADAIHSVQTISKGSTLSKKLQSLRNWSTDIDTATRMAQIRIEDEHLQKVTHVARARAGSQLDSGMNNPSSSSHSPSGGAMSSPTQPTAFALTGDDNNKPSAAAFSDVMGGMPQSQDGTPLTSSSPPSGGVSSKRIFAEAMNIESGSADDLLPIHQYVLVKANIPYLIAEAQMLVDLSSDDTFVDSTSQDAFCITTLHACISILPQLDMQLRDSKGIVAPASVFEKRIEDNLQTLIMDSPSLILSNVVEFVALLFDSIGSGTSVNIIPKAAEIKDDPPTFNMGDGVGGGCGVRDEEDLASGLALEQNTILLMQSESLADQATRLCCGVKLMNAFEAAYDEKAQGDSGSAESPGTSSNTGTPTSGGAAFVPKPLPVPTQEETNKMKELHYTLMALDSVNMELYMGSNAAEMELIRCPPSSSLPKWLTPSNLKNGKGTDVAALSSPTAALSPSLSRSFQSPDAKNSNEGGNVTIAVKVRKPLPPSIYCGLAEYVLTLEI